jgi:hypothetical protein
MPPSKSMGGAARVVGVPVRPPSAAAPAGVVCIVCAGGDAGLPSDSKSMSSPSSDAAPDRAGACAAAGVGTAGSSRSSSVAETAEAAEAAEAAGRTAGCCAAVDAPAAHVGGAVVVIVVVVAGGGGPEARADAHPDRPLPCPATAQSPHRECNSSIEGCRCTHTHTRREALSLYTHVLSMPVSLSLSLSLSVYAHTPILTYMELCVRARTVSVGDGVTSLPPNRAAASSSFSVGGRAAATATAATGTGASRAAGSALQRQKER